MGEVRSRNVRLPVAVAAVACAFAMSGCADSQDAALTKASAACAVPLSLAVDPDFDFPDKAQVSEWQAMAERAADTAAEAAVLDQRWKGLSRALAKHAQTNAELADLWRSLIDADGGAGPGSDDQRLLAAMRSGGVTLDQMKTVASEAQASLDAVEPLCREVRAAERVVAGSH